MNKIYSPFISIFVLPLRAVFKTSKKIVGNLKLDTFLGGLLIGAIFSLVVNVITIRITDDITKQRALEAMENEIASNYIQAEVTFNMDNKLIKSKTSFNPFYNFNTYSENVFSNPLTLQYFDQLDPSIQEKVDDYYTYGVKNDNEFIDKLSNLSQSTFVQGCLPTGLPVPTQTANFCKSRNMLLLNLERSTAIQMYNNSLLVLKEFHPTKDRLKNWYLRLLIGDKGLPVLTLPPKIAN